MEIRVIDFEDLTKNFQPYVDGYKNIESKKREMLSSIESDRKEMENILKRSQSGLIVDEMTQRQEVERFKKLQEKLMKLDVDFKNQLKSMTDDLNDNVYEQLSSIITKWSKENSIDLVIGKMEVVFNTSNIEITDDIIDIIKQKNLYYTEKEED